MTTRMTKSQAAAMVRRGAAVETFHHVEMGIFNISDLRRMVLMNPGKYPVFMSEITPRIVEMLEHEREVCPLRCAELSGLDLASPVFLIDLPDGTSLLVDGSHRLAERLKRGWPTFLFRRFPAGGGPLCTL